MCADGELQLGFHTRRTPTSQAHRRPRSQSRRSGERAGGHYFHCGDAASTSHASPGHQTLPLEGPNLHRRAKNHPFSSPPRPKRPPELRKNGGPTDERTWFSLHLFSRREREASREERSIGLLLLGIFYVTFFRQNIKCSFKWEAQDLGLMYSLRMIIQVAH